MRKSLLALAMTAAVLPTFAVADQDCPCHEHNKMAHKAAQKAEVPHGMRGLDLSKDQLKALAELRKDQREDQKDITERYLGKLSVEDKAALQKDTDAARAAHQQAVEKVLTPEQLKKYQEKREKAQAAHAEWEEFQKWRAEKAAAAAKAAPAPEAKQ